MTFDSDPASNRISSAYKIFGEKVIKRILAFAFFLLGVNRKEISKQLDIPLNTVKSNIKALQSDGIAAFEDRRQKTSTFLPLAKSDKGNTKISITSDSRNLIVTIGSDITINMPAENKLQCKSFLLTLLNNYLITTKEAAKALNLTTVHITNLAKKIELSDIDSLIEQRKGQTHDFIFTPEIKAELIQQYVLASVSNQKTSGTSISRQLKERCELNLSDRTIRYHIAKLGLSDIKKTLPELIADLKKTFKMSAGESQ